MEPKLPELDSFDYLGGGPGELSGGHRIGIVVLVIFALISLLDMSFFWLLFFGGWAYLVYRKGKRKVILIGPRYLICANEIVYFHNVLQADLQESDGKLILRLPEDKTFTLESRLMATRRNILAGFRRAPGEQKNALQETVRKDHQRNKGRRPGSTEDQGGKSSTRYAGNASRLRAWWTHRKLFR